MRSKFQRTRVTSANEWIEGEGGHAEKFNIAYYIAKHQTTHAKRIPRSELPKFMGNVFSEYAYFLMLIFINGAYANYLATDGAEACGTAAVAAWLLSCV